MTQSQTTSKQNYLILLNQLIECILSKERSENASKIFFFVRRTLIQFHLHSDIEESDIIIEAYLRTIKSIKSGLSINNLSAYLTRVCYNIIREYSREQKKSEELCNSLAKNHLDLINSDLQISGLDEEKIIILKEALKRLSSEELRLLQLRIVEELSWKEINKYYTLLKDIQCLDDTSKIRKRGQRALKRLRGIYLSIEKGGR